MTWKTLPLACIAELLPVGMAVAAADGRIEYANAALRQLLVGDAGSTEAVKGRRLDVYRPAAPECTKGSAVSGHETRLHRADGVAIPVRETVFALGSASEGGCSVHFFLDLRSHKELETLRPLAFYDTLTGLPNRNMFNDRLSRALADSERSHRGFALLYADIDGFKAINDRFGHGAGDLVLRSTGQRMVAGLRKSDSLTRLGGDEFAAILPGAGQYPAATAAADKLLANCRAPHRLDDGPVCATLSIGIALFPQDARDPAALLRSADQALYRAKLAGRDRWCLANSDPESRAIHPIPGKQALTVI